MYLCPKTRSKDMDKNIVKQLIVENQAMLKDVALVRRDIEFEPNSNYVLVGLRRAGKSYLLYQRFLQLVEQGCKAEEILYFNFEDDRLGNIEQSDLDTIKQAYEELYEHRPVFMLDEIQIVDGWEKFARRLADQKYCVYITGSNAKMLSSDISTTLGGRYVVQNVHPFSFREYLEAKGVELAEQWEHRSNTDIKRHFNEYFRMGGLPEVKDVEPKFRRQWLSNLYNKIYFGDLLARYNIRNVMAMKLLVRKLAESVKQPLSFNRLANLVSSVAGRVKQDTVADYVEYIKDTCMVFSVENVAAKLQDKVSNQKYYFEDNGLLNLFLTDPDTSLLENLAAIFLHSCVPDDLFFYNDKVEVDFCLFEQRQAYQVSWSVQDPATRDREVRALLAYQKRYGQQQLFIITMDEEEVIETDGCRIEVIPIWKWLLSRNTCETPHS